jgi:hypothetical protein
MAKTPFVKIVAGVSRSGIADVPPRFNRIGVSIVTEETRRMERIGAFKAPGISWRDLVRRRIDAYLRHDSYPYPNFFAVY